ncbi:17-beta-hydroxysteroid dehydrogenase 13-like isoform X1 [Gigantopelta aegis]|uniref:17-beta-hydroxysteroid dehydrogenase 13-like isoform X1 n=1 Tax=Gigantopelta aegis TaxID=1735272 RepID=UPI001B88C4EA|nr:17-beta-hydroxysteroid dehydrogenase 13-like isoform X1 [Gigantopelta aegis]
MHILLELCGVFFKVFILYIKALYFILFPPSPKDILGEIVLITGAGHGIGKELALEFSRRGTTVVLWDINKENNDNTAKEVQSLGGVAYPYTCDISNTAEIHKVAEQVRQDVGEITILVNNAGCLNGGAVLDLQEKDIRRTFDVNILAHFWGLYSDGSTFSWRDRFAPLKLDFSHGNTVKEFLPSMIKTNHGYILNIASLSAKSGTAFLGDYSSSKSAVFGFTESLREELDRLGNTGIQATVVCPLFVDTGLAKFPKQRFFNLLTPKETAWNAVDGMLRGETVVFVPRYMWLMIKLEGLLPQKAIPMLKKFQELGIDPQYKPVEKKTE